MFHKNFFFALKSSCLVEGAARFEEEVPLNLSTKPSDVSSSLCRKSEIWSPGSVCEREARETSNRNSPTTTTPLITRQIHHSPLTPPASTERTFQVSATFILIPFSINVKIGHFFATNAILSNVPHENSSPHIFSECKFTEWKKKNIIIMRKNIGKRVSLRTCVRKILKTS